MYYPYAMFPIKLTQPFFRNRKFKKKCWKLRRNLATLFTGKISLTKKYLGNYVTLLFKNRNKSWISDYKMASYISPFLLDQHFLFALIDEHATKKKSRRLLDPSPSTLNSHLRQISVWHLAQKEVINVLSFTVDGEHCRSKCCYRRLTNCF